MEGESAEILEKFHGVYLLYCRNEKLKGRVYVGYTVDPNRRIKQHNKGCHFGGARKTSSKGPWEMALIIHGFPSDIAALRFEWAWQHHQRSRRLRGLIPAKKRKESSYDMALRVMWTMLQTAPWSRLPLTLRWLCADLVNEPLAGLAPPAHMAIVHGPVVAKKLPNRFTSEDICQERNCGICTCAVPSKDVISCVQPECTAFFHIFCLAGSFLSKERSPGGDELLPVEGVCPFCKTTVLWGDLVRKRQGCVDNFSVE